MAVSPLPQPTSVLLSLFLSSNKSLVPAAPRECSITSWASACLGRLQAVPLPLQQSCLLQSWLSPPAAPTSHPPGGCSELCRARRRQLSCATSANHRCSTLAPREGKTKSMQPPGKPFLLHCRTKRKTRTVQALSARKAPLHGPESAPMVTQRHTIRMPMLPMRSCACLTIIMHEDPNGLTGRPFPCLFLGQLRAGIWDAYKPHQLSHSPVLSTGPGLPTQASFSSEGLTASTVNWARFPNCAFSISSNGRDRSKMYPLQPTESTW